MLPWADLCAAFILLAADLITRAVAQSAFLLVSLMDYILKPASTRRMRPCHAQRWATRPVFVQRHDHICIGELDVKATLAMSRFPIPPKELVECARRALAAEFGCAAGFDPTDFLTEDFLFAPPIAEPLCRDEFVRTTLMFRMKEAFPDLRSNITFQVDPVEPNRVWCFSRTTATHTGTFGFEHPLKPTGREVRLPPQAQSMLFHNDKRIYMLTGGYCMDKGVGNTEGLVGALGMLKGIGHSLPFPEAQRLCNTSLRLEAFKRFCTAIAAAKSVVGSRQPRSTTNPPL